MVLLFVFYVQFEQFFFFNVAQETTFHFVVVVVFMIDKINNLTTE